MNDATINQETINHATMNHETTQKQHDRDASRRREH